MANKKEQRPVENHKTAAWANIENTDRASRVAHPGPAHAAEAKEYVDENEK